MPTVNQVIEELKELEGQHIAVAYWSENDVLEWAEDNGIELSREEAIQVIDHVDAYQYKTGGIDWDVIASYVDELVSAREAKAP